MRFSWYIERLLEKIGLPNGEAYLKTKKIRDFESWITRESITVVVITFDPKDCLNEWKEISVALDSFRLEKTYGRWQKHFIFQSKASPTTENNK